MRSKLSPQRKRIVTTAAAIGGMSGGPILLQGHRYLLLGWIGVMAAGLVYVMTEMVKLKRSGNWC